MTGLWTILLGAFLAQVAPGPNSVVTARSALAGGRRAGLLTAAGVASGVLLWALLFSLGLGVLLEDRPGLLTGLELAGGVYLLFYAWHGWKTRDAGQEAGGPPARRGPAYRTGLLVTMTNPKAAMLWVAISAYAAALGLSLGSLVMLGFGVAGSALAVYGGYALVFSTDRAMRAYRARAARVQGALSAAFAAIGAALLATGLGALA